MAFGGGLELALACDMRIAATVARVSRLPEVRIGSLPGSGGTQRLPAVVGPSLAAQMILTGEPIDAARALAAGLVYGIVRARQLLDAAWRIAAHHCTQRPARGDRRQARIARRGRHASTSRISTFERKLFNELALSEDRNEGRQAFREKRQPVFKGK